MHRSARPDGRKALEMRPITIERDVAPHAEGSCLIVAGLTRVLVTATVEEKVPPFLRETGEGWVTAEYGMLPRATHERSPREAARGKQSGRTLEIQRLIGRALRSAVALDKLGERTIALDCDVLEADGGTRTASITGSFVALGLALAKLRASGALTVPVLRDQVAAISVGMLDNLEGGLALDLVYTEDSAARVDLNLVATGAGAIIEVQGTAEGEAIPRADLDRMIDLAAEGVVSLCAVQRAALKASGVELDSLLLPRRGP